jgi:hypothetical protein
MPWDVEYTNQFEEFWDGLTLEQQTALRARVTLVREQGPELRRPYVGEILTSRHSPRMKELICNEEGALRVLFIFDPRRTAILLLGGDKSGLWDHWYETAVPEADNLYDVYLQELRNEGLI